MYIYIYDKMRPATEKEKAYVKALSPDAIDESIETDGLYIDWNEHNSPALYSTKYPEGERSLTWEYNSDPNVT